MIKDSQMCHFCGDCHIDYDGKKKVCECEEDCKKSGTCSLTITKYNIGKGIK